MAAVLSAAIDEGSVAFGSVEQSPIVAISFAPLLIIEGKTDVRESY